MVARDVRGNVTRPTVVERDKDGKPSYPNDPHINTGGFNDDARPQTLHSGYSQGGTTNPPAGDDGSVKFYAPKDRKAGGIGKEEDTAAPQQKRDAETNPVPHDAGPRFTDTAGTSDSKNVKS